MFQKGDILYNDCDCNLAYTSDKSKIFHLVWKFRVVILDNLPEVTNRNNVAFYHIWIWYSSISSIFIGASLKKIKRGHDSASPWSQYQKKMEKDDSQRRVKSLNVGKLKR